MTPQEETVILEARDILGRYLSQNPVIGRGAIAPFGVLPLWY